MTHLNDTEVWAIGFNRFNCNAQVRRAMLFCDRSFCSYNGVNYYNDRNWIAILLLLAFVPV